MRKSGFEDFTSSCWVSSNSPPSFHRQRPTERDRSPGGIPAAAAAAGIGDCFRSGSKFCPDKLQPPPSEEWVRGGRCVRSGWRGPEWRRLHVELRERESRERDITCAHLSVGRNVEKGKSSARRRHTFTRPPSSLPPLSPLSLSPPRSLITDMSANERSTRALKEILQNPGNDTCADCGAPGRTEVDFKNHWLWRGRGEKENRPDFDPQPWGCG